MYEFIEGKLENIEPDIAIILSQGIGYHLMISFHTFEKIKNKEQVRLYTYLHVREDLMALVGFSTKEEKSLFLILLNIQGVGLQTARLILSKFSVEELHNIAFREDEKMIATVKGIGIKSAKKIIIDLKSKLEKNPLITPANSTSTLSSNSFLIKQQATTALVNLGFSQPIAQKMVQELLQENPQLTIEELLKKSLSKL